MKATITRRVDECTFQCGYEMRRCTACGKSARTVPVLLSLECGAELMGFVCKTCVHAAAVEDTRPHVHVGPEAQIVPSTSHKHLVMETACSWHCQNSSSVQLLCLNRFWNSRVQEVADRVRPSVLTVTRKPRFKRLSIG